jgi:dihydroorotate dehydrogenase (fumarate)
MIDLTTHYMGIQLKNPIIVGSCSMTGNIEEIMGLEENGAGAVVLKSIFEEEILNEIGYSIQDSEMEKPGFAQLAETLKYVNQHVTQNRFSQYISFISDVKKKVGIPVFASINCISEGEWTQHVHKLEEAGADGLELNIFLSRSGLSGLNYEKSINKITKSVLQKLSIPVSIKLGNCFADQAQSISKLSKTGISGIVLFNKFNTMDIDVYNLSNTTGKILSNADDSYQSLRWIALMSGKVGCSLAGATGIHHANAVIKQVLAGADAVQLVSTLYLNGKTYIRQILDDLELWMDKKGFFSLKQAKGLSGYKDILDTVVFERIQFMKHYGRIL